MSLGNREQTLLLDGLTQAELCVNSGGGNQLAKLSAGLLAPAGVYCWGKAHVAPGAPGTFQTSPAGPTKPCRGLEPLSALAQPLGKLLSMQA